MDVRNLIIIFILNLLASGTLANAGWCSLKIILNPNSNYVGPNFGRVKYNFGNFASLDNSNSEFEEIFEITIHELTHIMGFSGGSVKYWANPSTGNP